MRKIYGATALVSSFTLFGLLIACSSEQVTDNAPPAVPSITRSPISETAPSPTPITAAPTVFSAPSASVIHVDDTPISSQTELLDDAQQVLDIAMANFRNADSYVAEVITEVEAVGEDSSTIRSVLNVDAPHRYSGTNYAADGDTELIYVNGLTHTRTAGQPDAAWTYIGRSTPYAVRVLTGSMPRIQDPLFERIDSIDGVPHYSIVGTFATGRSGPPPPSGHNDIWHLTATLIVNAETMLPVFASTVQRLERIELETRDSTTVLLSTIETTFTNYGIQLEIEHPRSVLPTTVPIRATPTSAPTQTSRE